MEFHKKQLIKYSNSKCLPSHKIIIQSKCSEQLKLNKNKCNKINCCPIKFKIEKNIPKQLNNK